MKWIKVAEHSGELSFASTNLVELMAEERKICLAKFKGDLFAFAPKCPHAGGNFSEGFIDALGNVVCPLHHYKFCLKNGRNISGEGYYLKHWPVEIRDDGVYVGLKENGLLKWLY